MTSTPGVRPTKRVAICEDLSVGSLRLMASKMVRLSRARITKWSTNWLLTNFIVSKSRLLMSIILTPFLMRLSVPLHFFKFRQTGKLLFHCSQSKTILVEHPSRSRRQVRRSHQSILSIRFSKSIARTHQSYQTKIEQCLIDFHLSGLYQFMENGGAMDKLLVFGSSGIQNLN